MTSTLLLSAILILIVAGVAVLWPFLLNRQLNQQKRQSVVALEDSLRQFVMSVRDLDFDFDMGKITETDYIEQRKVLIGRGVSTLKKLDELHSQQHHIEDEIEQMVAAYRKKNAL